MITAIATTLLTLAVTAADLNFPGDLRGKDLAAVQKHFPGEWQVHAELKTDCPASSYNGQDVKVGTETVKAFAVFYQGKLLYLLLKGNHNVSVAVAEKYGLLETDTPYTKEDDDFIITVRIGAETYADFVDKKLFRESRNCRQQNLQELL